MNPEWNPQVRAALRRHRVVAVAAAFALLVLVVGAPVWASTLPDEMQQGTVPVPPLPGGGDSGGSSSGGASGSDRGGTSDPGAGLPEATATPAAEGQAADPNATPASPASTLTGVVSAPRLNVRSGPGLSYAVIGKAVQGQTVNITARDDTGSWWYVCCVPGTTTSGWVSALFVTPDFDAAQALALIPLATNIPVAAAPVSTPAAPAVAQTTGLTGTVAVARLNLRGGPGVEHAIVGKLLLGETLEVSARNASGDWWYVCCLGGTRTPGWVSAEFVQPAFARDRANALLALYGEEEVHVILPTPTPKPSKVAAAAGAPVSATAPATTTLAVSVDLAPEFAAPGSMLQLAYMISNTGLITATSIELRNEVAAPLAISDGRARGANAFQAQGDAAGRSLVTVQWPLLAPGDSVTATLQLTMSAEVTPGTVIDNLAAVAASNARSTTAGVSIGLPPAALPDFQ